MPLDPTAVGRTVDHDPIQWDERDVMIYALSLGAGSDDLAHTTENTEGQPLRAYPWMPVIYCQPPAEVWDSIGTFDWRGLVHAEQRLDMHRPFPVTGTATGRTRVVDMYDKGSAAIVVTETELRLPSGDLLATGRGLTFIRGAGGWGGDRGPSAGIDDGGATPPDRIAVAPTDPRQPLLYRINGDRNPLHSDPAFAREAGFDRPILHGLCTLGVALRSVLALTDPVEERTIRTVRTRFARPVFPGEELTTSVWTAGDTVRFTAASVGETVLDRGAVVFS
jgi:acyl dehydratase